MTGGITLWKDRGYEVEVPQVADQGAARALLAPPARARDRARGPDQAARRQGAAARRRRPRLADRALPRRRRRRHARHRRRRRRRPLQPAAPGHPHDRPHRRRRRSTPPRSAINGDQPRRERRQVPDAPRRLQHHGDHRGLRRDRRRRRQLPDALPAQRRDGAAGHPGRLGLDPRLRRPALGLQAARRPVLPLPVPGAAAGRAGARPAAPTACSACCRARWACCRRPRSSSSSPAPASR